MLFDDPTDRGYELDRLKALSDGVFAIVMTLLVLELRIPEVARLDAEKELLRGLVLLLPKFIAFIVTFLISGLYWVVHTRFIRHIKSYDRRLLGINLLLLLTVSLFPFSAGMIGNYPNYSTSWIAYAVNQFFVGVFAALLWRHALKHNLTGSEVTPQLAKYVQARTLVIPLACLLSIPLALVNPLTAGIAFWIVPFAMKIIERKLAPKQAQL